MQHLAQTAGTDKAKHSRHADVVFPAIQRIGQPLRQHARQRSIEEGNNATGSRLAQRGRRRGRGVLQRLGKQAAQHAGGVQRQCQGAGKGAEPGGQHHQGCPDQLRYRA